MTPIVFIDTETTSLRPDRRAWEVGLIVREPWTVRHPDGPDTAETRDTEHHWFIETADLDLGNADLFSLKVGKFYDRHPQVRPSRILSSEPAPGGVLSSEFDVLRRVEAATRGAHLAGAVVNFDADVLGARMRAHGICPSWHYHLIDVEALAVGWLNGCRAQQNAIVDGYPLENDGEEAPGLVRWNDPVRGSEPPWKSDDLTAALGLDPVPDDERHTALGDARFAMAIYDKVMAV